jgi:hypothetical protein
MRKEGKTNFKNIKKRGENYNEEAENRSESHIESSQWISSEA